VLARAVEAWARRHEVGGGVVAVGTVHGRELAPFGTVRVGGVAEPAAAGHRYLLTSVSKAITATQVLALAHDGRLDLDAAVAEYVPAFAVNGKGAITVAHLLAHTSGLDNSANLVEGPPTSLSSAEYLRISVEARPTFPPGSAWQYCSPGYWVLGAVIAAASGVPYTDDLVARIGDPLALPSLRYEPDERPPEGYVDAERPDPQQPEQIRRSAYPAGAMVATAGDVLGFALGVLDGFAGRRAASPVGPAALPLLRRVLGRGTHMGRPAAWTYGWQLGGPGSLRSEATLFHVGASGTALWVDPVRDVALALLTATWWPSPRALAELANGAFAELAAMQSRAGRAGAADKNAQENPR
jgi:CubicO group peptidase (beta-lactamase class C family)